MENDRELSYNFQISISISFACMLYWPATWPRNHADAFLGVCSIEYFGKFANACCYCKVFVGVRG